MEKTKSQELPLDTANVTQEKVNRQKTFFPNYSFMFSKFSENEFITIQKYSMTFRHQYRKHGSSKALDPMFLPYDGKNNPPTQQNTNHS